MRLYPYVVSMLITVACSGDSSGPEAVAIIGVTSPVSLIVGTDAQLSATPHSASGTTLTGRTMTWSSSNTAVATVNGGGLLHGVTAGAAVITVSSEGVTATIDVTVNSAPIAGRWLQGMVYDEARSVLLVFGGSRINGTTGVFFNDLWSWNGTTWTQIATPTAPSPRDEMLLVYDASRQRVVMHGGRNETGSLTDTWEWDGTAWQQRSTSGPPARKHAGGGYDRARARTVLYGGQNPSDVVLTDTWEWDGSTWSQRATTRPSPLDAPTNPVFDATRNALVMLIGGFTSGPTEMWQWSGSAWTSIGTGPTMSMPNSIAVIGPSNLLMYDTSSPTAATWQWNGTAWTNLGITSPSRRFAASMAYDQSRSRTVLFGGSSGGAYVSETWTFASGAWTQVP